MSGWVVNESQRPVNPLCFPVCHELPKLQAINTLVWSVLLETDQRARKTVGETEERQARRAAVEGVRPHFAVMGPFSCYSQRPKMEA